MLAHSLRGRPVLVFQCGMRRPEPEGNRHESDAGRYRVSFPGRAGALGPVVFALVMTTGFVLKARALPAPGGGPSPQLVTCKLVEDAAHGHGLPIAFLTKLIWQESSFRPDAVSPAGAQGIAQFMPGTASERGLADPFDPAEAVPHAAALLAELKGRFGNLGLAAAAYNAGPRRVSDWLAGKGLLPLETESYVTIITGDAAEEWRAAAPPTAENRPAPDTCFAVLASLRRRFPTQLARSTLLAPWGVQLAGSFSKSAALAAFARARGAHPSLLSEVKPMILSGRFLSMGTRPYYRIRAPAPTRAAANDLCKQIEHDGGACVVLRS